MNTMGNETMRTVVNNFADDYLQRDKDIEFSEWLENKLREEIPDLDDNTSKNLAGEIIEAVANYNTTIEELNKAIDRGQAKEEWFAEKLSATYEDMDIAEAGKTLQQIENMVNDYNEHTIFESRTDHTYEEHTDETPEEWNKYSIKNIVYKLGRQMALFGLANAAKAMENKVQGEQITDVGNFEKELFQDCLKNNNAEVKAMIAGAIEVVAAKKLEENLTLDIPVGAICDIAGFAADGVQAMLDVVDGTTTMTEALDKVERSGVVAGCRYCSKALKGYVAVKLGPIGVDLLGGLFEHMEGKVFADNVQKVVQDMYKMIYDASVATWEGIKKSVGNKVQMVKTVLLN